jgi:SAM-dependent methyltransferase
MSGSMTFDRFVRWNITVSDRLSPTIEQVTHPYPKFDRVVADFINSHDDLTVVDIGAGRHCDYSNLVIRRPARMVGVDISGSELALNDFLDERIAADACAPMPELEGKVDLLVSKATMEHLPNNEAFLRNARKLLKPGGTMVLLFTNRYAPFAFINRVLPARVSTFLLAKLAPVWAGQVGFKTHYDRTNYSAFSRMLKDTGFGNAEFQVGYFSSAYFRFLVPVYLISLGFDRLRYALQIKNLGSYYLVIARAGDSPAG